MKPKIDTKHKIWKDVLSRYQIVGGALGVIFTLLQLGPLMESAYGLVFFLVLVGLFVFSGYCGVLLYMEAYEDGLFYSLINQALQVVQLSLAGVSFKYISGLGVTQYYHMDEGYFTTSVVLSTANIYVSGVMESVVGINVVAVGLVILIFYLRH